MTFSFSWNFLMEATAGLMVAPCCSVPALCSMHCATRIILRALSLMRALYAGPMALNYRQHGFMKNAILNLWVLYLKRYCNFKNAKHIQFVVPACG